MSGKIYRKHNERRKKDKKQKKTWEWCQNFTEAEKKNHYHREPNKSFPEEQKQKLQSLAKNIEKIEWIKKKL